ncbi:IPT/TIG domain-containing protein [Patescibacteria group bacterium]|nr:IPT/TIG domain-containing protein [Patescibacteria group bacterium]
MRHANKVKKIFWNITVLLAAFAFFAMMPLGAAYAAGAAPSPTRAISAPILDTIGQYHTFYVVSSYDASGRSQVQAKLVEVSTHGYFYVDSSWYNTLSTADQQAALSDIQQLATNFDTIIYPTETQDFAPIGQPQGYTDPRVTILLTPMTSGVGGYFNAGDMYATSVIATSNDRNMVYLDADVLGDPRMNAFLAHEFQHMITFYAKYQKYGLQEETWLNELRSEYAPTLDGFDNSFSGSNLYYRVSDFLSNPYYSLLNWQESAHQYGIINLLAQYISEHYPHAITQTIKEQSVGIQSFNQAFQQLGYSTTFASAFNDWEIANTINDPVFDNGQYSYTNTNLSNLFVSPVMTFPLASASQQVSFSGQMNDWSAKSYEIDNSLLNAGGSAYDLTIKFSTQNSEKFIVDVLAQNAVNGNQYALTETTASSTNSATIAIPDFSSQDSGAYIVLVPENATQGKDYTNTNPPLYSYLVSATLTPAANANTQSTTPATAAATSSATASSSPAVTNSAVSINAISLAQAPTSGGERITISGTGFAQGAQVSFGGVAAQSTVTDANTITATVPAYSQPMLVSITVANLDGSTATDPGAFLYIAALSPQYLYRAAGDYKVYQIHNGYKRHIVDPTALRLAGFSFADVRVVPAVDLADYPTSSLIQAAGDYHVYSLDDNAVKHWLDMTAAQFAASGRSWNAIFPISPAELNYYATGAADMQ